MKFNLILHVLSPCQLSCADCGQGMQRANSSSYQMSIEEVRNLLRYCEESGYTINKVLLSGGEPLLWKNLKEGLKLLRESDVVDKIIMVTNCINKMSDEIVGMLDAVDASIYKQSDREFYESLKERYPEKRIYLKDKTKFYAWPDGPIENSVPGKCWCAFYMYANGKITSCGEILEIYHRYGISTDGYIADVDGPNFLDKIETDVFGKMKNHCSICIMNKNVIDKVDRSIND